MNTTINNVKKELEVNFPKKEVESKMKFLCTDNKYYKSFDDKESIIGLYKFYFKKPISGFVDSGMQVHVSLNEIGENKTKIIIEVIDNWKGTDGYDINSSNILMDAMTQSLSKVLSSNIDDLTENSNTVLAKDGDDGGSISVGGIIGGIIFIILLIFIWMS